MKRTEQLKTIYPKEAEKLLQLNNFSGQRNIREAHALQLAQKMDDGRFHVGSVALVHKDGQTTLADGQHQLTACILSGKPFKAVVQEYELNGVDDGQALARIFSQFNVDSPRTRGDIAWIYANELGWGSWRRKLVTNLASALTTLVKGDFGSWNTSVSKDASAALMAENQKACEWAHGLDVASNRHLVRAPVLAAMIATWRKSQKAADEFWTAVRDGDNLKRSDPRFVLREFLKDVSLQGGENNKAGRTTVDRRAMFCKCIHAWNAWRQDRPTNLKYHAKASVPKPL